MKYGILVALIIAGAAIGGYQYFSGDKNTKQIIDDAPTVDTILINMDGTAFSPNTITVKKNTKVVFKNISDEPRWPASNIHPTHGIYPEFDPERPIQPGELWSFVFAKIGIWRMHDHLAPRILGTITVTE